MSRQLLQVPSGNRRPHKTGVCASPAATLARDFPLCATRCGLITVNQAPVLSQTCKLPHVRATPRRIFQPLMATFVGDVPRMWATNIVDDSMPNLSK